MQSVLQRLAAEEGVSLVQMRLLGVLRDREPPMKELANLLGLDKSSTSGLVERAERRGLVTRSLSSRDRRSVLVSLTDDARTRAAEVAQRFSDEISTMLARLPARERDELSRLASSFVVAQASERGIDLFADVQADPAEPTHGSRLG